LLAEIKIQPGDNTVKDGEDISLSVTPLIEEIRDYSEHDDLKACHHFLFCLPQGGEPGRRILVMGYNPGETEWDWKTTNGKRAEETILHDFHENDRSTSSTKWMSNVRYFCGDAETYLTEFVFWSSPKVKDLKERIGPLNKHNQHIAFCTRMNKQLIKILDPGLVIFTGVSSYNSVAQIYDLEKVEEGAMANGQKLYIHGRSDDVDWIFSRHWTGSFGFPKEEKERLKNKISVIMTL
tara:strand:- start:2777 stop:3487 length:711 start_codon:yes stop_codon:yes gene_type:complete